MPRSAIFSVMVLAFTFSTTARATTIEAATPVEFAADIAFQDVLNPGSIVNFTSLDFNGILPTATPFEAFNPLVVDGVSFSTPTPGAFVNVTTADFYAPNDYAGDFIVDSANASPTQTLVISFPLTYAVSLVFGGLFTGGGNMIALSNGFVVNQASSPTVGNTEFRGFVSSDPFSSLTLTLSNDSWVVEDFTVTSPAPEPATLTLTALGLAGVVCRSRRRRATR